MVWNINSFISLFTLLMYGALLVTVLLVKPHTKERRSFQVYLLMMFIWSLSSFFVFNSQHDVLFWFRLMTASGFSTVVVIFYFLQVTLNQSYRWAHWAYLYGLFIIVISSLSNSVIQSAVVENGVILSYEFSDAMPFLISPAFLLTFVNFTLVWKAYKSTKSHQIRNRYLYLALGLLTIFIGSILNFTPLGNYPVDIAANFLAALLFAYSILKHKLLDITVVIRKGLFYFIPTTIISAAYFLAITLAMDIFHMYTGFQIFILSLVVAVITGLLIKPVQEKAQTYIDRIFFREKYDFGKMLERLGQNTATILEIDELLDMIMLEMANTLHINRVAFIQQEESSYDFQMVRSLGIHEPFHFRFHAKHPVIKWLQEHQQCLLASDMSVMPQFKALWEKEKEDIARLNADIFIPVIISGKLTGIFAAGKKLSDQSYNKEDQRLLTTLANQTAVSIQNAQLYRKEITHHKELNALYQLSQSLLETNQISEIMDFAARHTVEIVNATFVRVLVLSESGQLICKSAATARELNITLELGKAETPEIKNYFLNVLRDNNPTTLIKDALGMPRHIRKEIFLDLASSVYIAPIQVKQQLFGILVIGEERNHHRESFNIEKINLVNSIISQITSALNRALLHEELEENFFQTILALANAVDARDQYTSNHSSKMSQLAIAVCNTLECDEETCTAIYWASILHDIGKIGISDEILKKPGALTDEEWAIMRQHPKIGADIVKPIKKLEKVAPFIHYHHEKFDGSGYPDGLSGENIPLGARVITVVDAFEAMTADRIYRKGRSTENAIAELRRCEGSHFDPVVVEAFIQTLQNLPAGLSVKEVSNV